MQLILAPRFVIPILFLPARPLVVARIAQKSGKFVWFLLMLQFPWNPDTVFLFMAHISCVSLQQYNFKFKIVNHLI